MGASLISRRVFSSMLLSAGVVACGDGRRGGRASATTLRIGGPSDLAMLVVLARELGLFEARGVDVTYQHLQTGKVAQDALVSGDLDLGVIVDTNIAFAGFQDDFSVRVVACVQEQTGDGVVARADRGIAHPADLRGRRIGYLPGTTSHVFLYRFLEKHGIAMNDVALLAMAPGAMQSAVVRGDVDAVSVFQPFRYNAAQQLGSDAIEFTDPDVYTAHALLAAQNAVLDVRGDDVRAVLQALIDAERYAADNVSAAQEILAGAVGFAPAALSALWPEFNLRVVLDRSALTTVRAHGDWIRATDEAFAGNSVPDYEAYFRPDLLAAVDADRVTFAG